MNDSERREGPSVARGGRLLPALCIITGILLLAAVLVSGLLLTVPRAFGYEIYHVESPSMTPSLPQGSVVYLQKADPEDVGADEIIAFAEGDGVVIHRVVQNRRVEGVFITRGDANAVNDPSPVPYAALVGRMVFHIPVVGTLLRVYASGVGRLYALLVSASGLILCLLGLRLRRKRYEAYRDAVRAKLLAETRGTAEQPAAEAEKPAPKKKRRWPLILAICVLLALFLGSGAAILYYNGRYRRARRLYEQAADEYVTVRSVDSVPVTGPDDTEPPAAETPQEQPPITVDFDALLSENADVVGWLYCEGTAINYPLVQGKDNDEYLHHAYDGSYCYAGSIFLEAANAPDFTDGNTVIYGHNMKDGSMFHCLSDWSEQAFYDAHPVLWLLTPEGNYKLELFSGRLTDARSGCYELGFPGEAQQQSYVNDALAASDFQSPVQPHPGDRLVLLSTCAYAFDEARYVLNARLVPLN